MKPVEWVLEARSGNQSAFTELVKCYQNSALGYAFSMLGDFQRAQDVVQESFIIAHSQLDQLEKPEAFLGWFKGIVRHRCLRVFRVNKKQMLPLEDVNSFLSLDERSSDEIQRSQEKEHLLEAIKALPENQRTVITLYYLEEQSQNQVAEFLGLPLTKINNDSANSGLPEQGPSNKYRPKSLSSKSRRCLDTAKAS